MKRRSFLTFLGLTPIAATSNPTSPPVEPDIPLIKADLGVVTGGSLRSANGKLVMDFTSGEMILRTDRFEVTNG